MKNFSKDNLNYSIAQDFGSKGQQWRCDYPNGEWAAAMIYKSKPTQQDVIEAIDNVNSRDHE